MENKKNDTRLNFTDIVDLHDNLITLKEIEYISHDLKTKIQFETRFRKNLYSNIMLYLTHKMFCEKEAKQLWIHIIEHRKQLTKTLERDPGIVVSCLDYMSNYEVLLKDPKIIEKGKSDYILSSTLIDNLTNLYIRNVFTVVLEKQFDISIRERLPLSLLLIDIDDFKRVNDLYGHAEGDRVLKQIGNVINISIRTMDFAARYGGEEMVVILPNTTLEFAIKVGELIRKRVNSLDFGEFVISISIGASEIGSTVFGATELMKHADKALYNAKGLGKNRVVGYSEIILEI